jgi:hypothetical protein
VIHVSTSANRNATNTEETDLKLYAAINAAIR